MPGLFERIIQGDLPATIVFRDDRVTAFRDIHPRAPTHILIVPNKLIPTANDVTSADEALLGHMFVVAAEIAAREGIAKDGKLHPLQQAWIDEQVPQCGFCQNGQIMTAKALLDKYLEIVLVSFLALVVLGVLAVIYL